MIFSHKPIQFKDVSLEFIHKNCFKNFNTQVNFGEKIAIIGRNGSGKSALLKILQNIITPTDGIIKIPEECSMGYVPQIINYSEEFANLSGGQRINKALTQALSLSPNVLLLDEPTNHLDLSNRKSLLKMLKFYQGTLIVVSHDVELLSNCINKLWHIENNSISIFSGNYTNYMQEINIKRSSVEQELFKLKHQQKESHKDLMQEQARAKHSKAYGEKNIKQRKWPTVTSATKAARSNETSGRKKNSINNKKQELLEQLSELYIPEIIKPTFKLDLNNNIKHAAILSISEGTVGYDNNLLLTNISLSISGSARIAIMGDNGSGKSTLIKAILNNSYNSNIKKSGNWYMPQIKDIGYLDQHYNTLNHNLTVFENIYELVPDWSYTAIRLHLNDFLFSKTEQVDRLVSIISGGEKARLSLAQIAAKTPKLLILDEIANNLDLETREHVIQVLKNYPGAMIVISHEAEFLKAIDIKEIYMIKNSKLEKN